MSCESDRTGLVLQMWKDAVAGRRAGCCEQRGARPLGPNSAAYLAPSPRTRGSWGFVRDRGTEPGACPLLSISPIPGEAVGYIGQFRNIIFFVDDGILQLQGNTEFKMLLALSLTCFSYWKKVQALWRVILDFFLFLAGSIFFFFNIFSVSFSLCCLLILVDINRAY